MYEIFAQLLHKYGVTAYKVSKETGVSQATLSAWKAGNYTPKAEKLQKIADYFHVPLEYLMTGNAQAKQQEKTPILTKKDERDIARDMQKFIDEMDQEGDLMFDGDPMTPEARESIIAAMKLGLEAAKMKNKERFTPKKYRKKD